MSDFPPPEQQPSQPLGGSWGAPPPPPGSWGAPPPPPPPPPGYTPYQGGAYGGPVYGPNPFESRGTTIMVIGILSLVICGLLGPVAWVMGNKLKSEAQAAGFPEPGNAKAGRICGIIATALLVFSVLFLVFFFVVAGLSAPTSDF